MGNWISNRGKTEDIGGKIFRALLILFSIVLIIMLFIALNSIRKESYVYITDPDDLLREIKNGNYPYAVTDMYDNIANGETSEKDSGYAVPYAIIEYFEAASLYKGYSGADLTADPARASVIAEAMEGCKSDMQDARSRMGELEFLASDIDDMFDLDEA